MLHLDRVSRSAYASLLMARNTAVKASAGNHFCTSTHARGKQSAITQWMDKTEIKGPTSYRVSTANILINTTHRNGAIYKRHSGFLGLWRLTRRGENFLIKLAKVSTNVRLVQLYGYIAVRDFHDSLLNYVVNCSRDNPIVVEQGSVIEMIGPKRGIAMIRPVLLEFDMKIKKGEEEDNDLQLIDGAIEYSEIHTPEYPFTSRINGDCGAVDVTLALVHRAVEATIDVILSEVQIGFDLSLSPFVITDGLHEIQLFRGSVGESCGLRRYVIAVKLDTLMHLKFKAAQKTCKDDYLVRHCSFEAKRHGYDYQQIMLELASISVKVTWSSIK